MQLTSSPPVAAALQYKTPQRRSVWNNKLLWGGSCFPLHSLRNHNFNPLVTAKTIGVFMFLSQQNNDKRICIYVVCHGLTLTSMVYEFIMGRHVTTKQGSVETEDVNLHRVLKGKAEEQPQTQSPDTPSLAEPMIPSRSISVCSVLSDSN